MTLLEEIQLKCSPELIASKEHGAIASIVSLGRTKSKHTKIGEGAILSTLGITTGNTFLDIINNEPSYRYVKKIVSRGDFDLGDPISQGGIQALVPAILTQMQADALLALATEPAPVSVQEVVLAMEGT